MSEVNLEEALNRHQMTLSPDAVSQLRRLLGDNVSEEEITDGVVHQVVRLKSSRSLVILKHRGFHCRRIPTAPLDPHDVRFEARALQLLNSLFPNLFPALLYFDEIAHTLILSDLAAVDLEEGRRFLNSASPQRLKLGCNLIVQTLAECHRSMRQSLPDVSLRPDGDQAFFNRNMFERIGYHGTEAAEALVQALAKLPRQLIIGDFGPKNMLIGEHSFRVFDLEHVHRGPVVFDVAFFLAHVVLHRMHTDSAEAIQALIDELLVNYESVYSMNSDDRVVIGPIIAAVMAYRLKNPIVPYALNLTDEFRERQAQESLAAITFATTKSPGEHIAASLQRAGVPAA